jgi:hypothetical protein
VPISKHIRGGGVWHHRGVIGGSMSIGSAGVE